MLIYAFFLLVSDFFCVVGVELSKYALSSLKSIKCYIMAKIKFGMMMTDARGKLGGQVFSKNRSGAYVRTKVTPVNPQTADQQVNRSLLGQLSSAWSSLTDSQRNSWNGAVEQWQKTNVFGDLTKPTGKNLFTGLNKVRLALFPELAQQNTPPAKVEFLAVPVNSVEMNLTSGDYFARLGEGFNVDQFYEVRATPPVSAGTSYVKNLLRSVSLGVSPNVTGYVNFAPGYIAKFGNAVVGQKIFIEVTQVAENGQRSVPVILVATIVA